ncbi:hypothetical protein LJ737_24000 [Hymenobacter sp. 15J16-1T3B]|uniref:hypothetical protein n=1 Tax=Hymenobacter sp. 15J16-1T3B TaxID=2886941 RepID=UPI001D12DD8E|nr:hypothetical protein [Hymenobacter sp. 15J16-1T3B]MCC3160322.1 hypothetical protein [Hymenobacter sp. 15J16-1T3B]
MKKLFTLLLLSLLALPGYCQMDHTSLVELFFTEYTLLGPEKALEHLYATSAAPQHNQAGFEQQRAELRKLTPENVGKYCGRQQIRATGLSWNLAATSYLVRFEQQPVRFTFTFYKAQDRWGLYAFTVDTDLAAELAETLKLNYPTLETRQP